MNFLEGSVFILDIFAQDFTPSERIKFLLIHMLQMEMLVVLLGTTLVALFFYNLYKKQNSQQAEQLFSRNLAVGSAAITLLLWLAGHMLR